MGISRRDGLAVIVAAGAFALSLSACHSNSATSASERASALATNSAAQVGKTDAETLIRHCLPSSPIGQIHLATSKNAREALYQCVGVPKADRQQAAACALGNLEKVKPPKGAQAREEWALAAVTPCVQKYQGGAK